MLTAPLMLALCVPVASDGCAGWSPVYMDADTARYLETNDPETLKAVIGNHEFARRVGCWK